MMMLTAKALWAWLPATLFVFVGSVTMTKDIFVTGGVVSGLVLSGRTGRSRYFRG